MMLRKVLIRAALGLGVAIAVSSASPADARAGTPPFSDPSSTGSIGLCDQAGNPVTSGNINDKPFVWTAVSSVAAGGTYTVARGAKATLYAVQPLQYVDPGDWSGQQMTAGSVYSADAHPMTQATVLDYSLKDFLAAFPAHWDGWVELRMLFTAPNSSAETTSYPTAVLKVSGDTWALASAGVDACGSGHAVSVETNYLPASMFTSSPSTSSQASSNATGLAGSTGMASTAASSSSPVKPSGEPGASAPANGSGSHDAGTRPTTARGSGLNGARGTSSGSASSNGVTPGGADGSALPASVNAANIGKSHGIATPFVLGAVVVLLAVGGLVASWSRRRRSLDV